MRKGLGQGGLDKGGTRGDMGGGSKGLGTRPPRFSLVGNLRVITKPPFH